jgi:hypothetical protein
MDPYQDFFLTKLPEHNGGRLPKLLGDPVKQVEVKEAFQFTHSLIKNPLIVLQIRSTNLIPIRVTFGQQCFQEFVFQS